MSLTRLQNEIRKLRKLIKETEVQCVGPALCNYWKTGREHRNPKVRKVVDKLNRVYDEAVESNTIPSLPEIMKDELKE